MKNLLLLSTLVCFVMCMTSCATNKLTGASQLSLVSEQELQSLSASQYKEFLKSHEVISPSKDSRAAMVQRVGKKIATAVEKYFIDKNNKAALDGFAWEYNLVNDSAINAWCMPGGKIVVYTGILSYTINENALAIVMGHEVSHALLQHGNKRMSESMIKELGGVALSAALSKKPTQTQNIFNQAYGIGTEVGIMLPFSRKQELEADRFGLIWAVIAGYDPNEAIHFWERMQKASGQKPPEFLSTHPSDETRIEKIKSYLPEALSYKK
ncbi:MAG: M48 family metallopeptidase [Sediminibacterium sp.]